MKTIKATHYIGIKEKSAEDGTLGKDKLIIKSGETRKVNKAELKLLEDEAKGRWVEVVEEISPAKENDVEGEDGSK